MGAAPVRPSRYAYRTLGPPTSPRTVSTLLGYGNRARRLDPLLAHGKRLTDGEDALDALLEQVRKLRREELARLGRRGQAKLAPALRVADEAPLDTHRWELIGGHLAGECAASFKVTILRGD